MTIDKGLALRAGLLQALSVGVLFVILALALPKSFFEDWGWLAGPGAWFACALITAAALGLPRDRTLAAAALAGLISLAGVLLDLHDVGGVMAIVAFGLLCGHIGPQHRRAGWLS